MKNIDRKQSLSLSHTNPKLNVRRSLPLAFWRFQSRGDQQRPKRHAPFVQESHLWGKLPQVQRRSCSWTRGAVAPPRFKKKTKKKIIIVYTSWIFLTFRPKIIIFGPPLPNNLQIGPQIPTKKKLKKKPITLVDGLSINKQKKSPRTSNKSLNYEI